MMRPRLVLVVLFGLALCLLATEHRAEALRDESYRAGYVMGYQEQAAASAADPTLGYERYADEKVDLLRAKGHVPMHFYRGLRDGFRDALRQRTPRYTIGDVDLSRLPVYLRPRP